MKKIRTMYKQLHESIKKRPFSTLIMTLFLLQACLPHVEPSHYGKVIDGETNEPLKDVAVILWVDSYCPRPPAGGDHETVAINETLTDERGSYKFPLKFYFLPFLCHYDDSLFIYFEAGYFEERQGRSDRGKTTKLYKMTHYLDYLWYKRHYYPSLRFQENSNYYRNAIDKLKQMQLIPADEEGVFLNLENRKFMKVYSSINRPESIRYVPDSVGMMIYYVYDETGNEWLAIDSRGRIVQLGMPALPEWHFFSSHDTWGYPIFADHDAIFYPVEKNPVPLGMEYKKGEIKYIKAVKGDISGLSGTVDSFFTIEDKGTLLCHYKNRQVSKCYKGENLPESREDDVVKSSEFKYITATLNHGYYIVTKTPKYWHIYNLHGAYAGNTFVELGTFSGDREITASAAWGSNLYLAFKNEGIRRFELGAPYYGKIPMKENTVFLKNSKASKYGEILSLNVGWGVNYFAVYAVTGENKIYRFSEDGIPDYPVRVGIQ